METPHKATIEFDLNDHEGRLAMERALKSREMCITIWSALRDDVSLESFKKDSFSKEALSGEDPDFNDGFHYGMMYVRGVILEHMEQYGITDEMIS